MDAISPALAATGIPKTVTTQSNTVAKAPSAQSRAIQEFTAVITSQFVGEILKPQEGLLQSGGMDSEVYHSMLVNAISEKLAETDAFGLAAVLEKEIG